MWIVLIVMISLVAAELLWHTVEHSLLYLLPPDRNVHLIVKSVFIAMIVSTACLADFPFEGWFLMFMLMFAAYYASSRATDLR